MRLAHQIKDQGYRVSSLTPALRPHDWHVLVERQGPGGPIKILDERYWEAARRRARKLDD
jgi:hypothetical protein